MASVEKIMCCLSLGFLRVAVLAAVVTGGGLLTACGGGSGSGDGGGVDLGEPVDPDNLPLGTFNFPVNELNYNFDERVQLQYWETQVWGGDPNVVIEWQQDAGTAQGTAVDDNGALIISPAWTATDDKFVVEADFAQDVLGLDEEELDRVDLTCANIKFFVRLPEDYVDDGNMGFKFYTKDSAGRYASLGWNSAADMTPGDWALINIDDISAQSFDFAESGHDMTDVQIIGVEFNANGKDPNIGGTIRLDNILITPAVIQDCIGDFQTVEVFGVDFENAGDLDTWDTDFTGGEFTFSATIDSAAGNPGGAAVFDFNWANAATDNLGYARAIDTVDLTGKTLRVDIYMPAAYVNDGNMGFKVYTKDAGFVYGSLGWNSTSTMTPDAWNTIEVANIQNDAGSFDFRGDGYDATTVGTIGLQFTSNGKPVSVAGDILIDNLQILEVVEGSGSQNKVLEDTFTEATDLANWEFDWAEGSLTSENINVTHSTGQGGGAMAFDLPWGDAADKLLWRRVNFVEPVNLTGAVVRADVYIPQAYVDDGNMGIKVFTKDVNWVYGSLGWNSTGGFTGDAWNTIEVVVSDAGAFDFTADGYDMTQVDKLGIELVANGKPAGVTGIIYVDNVEIILPQ